MRCRTVFICYKWGGANIVDKQAVLNILQNTYYEVFKKEPPSLTENLLNPKLGNYVIDYLYWIEALEDSLGYPVSLILESNDVSIMTIENLAEEICTRK